MFDVTLVCMSMSVCLILLKSLGSVGLGTIFAAVFVGITINILTKFFGKWRDDLLDNKATM